MPHLWSQAHCSWKEATACQQLILYLRTSSTWLGITSFCLILTKAQGKE